jgi:hypothetical protein
MKRIQAVAALLAISAIALATFPFAAAQTIYYPSLQIYGNNLMVVVYFKTSDPLLGSFDGRTVIKSSIQVMFEDTNYVVTTPRPVLIILLKDYVALVFCPSQVPAHGIFADVSGSLKSGAEFDASNPGWTWGGVHAG